MAQKPSMVPLIVVGGVAVAALLGINILQQNSDPAIVAEKQKEAERKASEEAAKNAPKDPAKPVAAVPAAGADELVIWGAKKSFGVAGGKPEITVTWEWTPAVQGNPSAVFSAVEAVKKTVPNAAITVVNHDMSGGNAPLGIAVNGTMRLPALSDGTFPPEQAIVSAVKADAPR